GSVLRLVNRAEIVERLVSTDISPHAGARDFDPREPTHDLAGLVLALVNLNRWLRLFHTVKPTAKSKQFRWLVIRNRGLQIALESADGRGDAQLSPTRNKAAARPPG